MDMNMTENANLVELLWELDIQGDEVGNFLLGVEGRISVKEAAARIKELQAKRKAKKDE